MRIFRRVVESRGHVSVVSGRVLSDFCPHKDSAGAVSWLRGIKAALGINVEMHEPTGVIIERLMKRG
jgi:ribosome modulation factor